MSELIISATAANNFRQRLLGGACIVVMLGVIALPAQAEDKPTVWIELGGQLERVDGGQEAYIPPFLSPPLPFMTVSPGSAERAPRYSFGGEGKVSFEPAGSDWSVVAAVRFGRSNNKRHTHETQYVKRPPSNIFGELHYTVPTRSDFSDIVSKTQQSHLIADFQVGKDVGFGLFGRGGSSQLHAGIRFAQFTSKSNATIHAMPDLQYYGYRDFPSLNIYFPAARFHNKNATGTADRSFSGLGPSVSWDASASIAGDPEAGEVTFDWGLNAAVLFGRQKARGEHHTSTVYGHKYYVSYVVPQTETTIPHSRKKSVVVPNVGGFAGLSLKFANAKVSMGYRADFFFGALDGGIDARKTYDRNFYGPFATISIGLP